MTKNITLHCPSRDITHPHFVILPFQRLDQILQGVRLTLDIPFAALYSTDAKLISDPVNLHDGQQLLIQASREEKVLPWAERGWVMYSGDEDERLEGMMWEDLTDAEKTEQIIRLVHDEPTTRNVLRITRSWAETEQEIGSLFNNNNNNKNKNKNNIQTSLPTQSDDASGAESVHERGTKGEGRTRPAQDEETKSLIRIRWATTLESFLHALTCSSKTKFHSPLTISPSPLLVPALGLLSSLTHGQPRLAREALEEAIQLRVDAANNNNNNNYYYNNNYNEVSLVDIDGNGNGNGDDGKDLTLRPEHVRVAVEAVYERAGVLSSKRGRERKSSGKARRENRERRKQAKETREEGKGKEKGGKGGKGVVSGSLFGGFVS